MLSPKCSLLDPSDGSWDAVDLGERSGWGLMVRNSKQDRKGQTSRTGCRLTGVEPLPGKRSVVCIPESWCLFASKFLLWGAFDCFVCLLFVCWAEDLAEMTVTMHFPEGVVTKLGFCVGKQMVVHAYCILKTLTSVFILTGATAH